ncbi:MAG: MFS transporter [Pseudomonadales bacterium]|nr:MFS transporter [Pseudomonadales bacterium]
MISSNPRVRFLGWRMVAVAFFVDFVAVGFFFYSYGVFFKAIAEEFGGSRLGVSLGLTITATVGALAAPLLGNALDRYPLKRIIALGAGFMTMGFIALSFVRSPLEFYLAIGLFIGFGASAMGGLATAKLVANWFVRKRGMALGIAATGISASGVVMPFISAALIDNYGWREGFMLYAAFTGLIVLPLVLKLVISRPEDVDLLPDGQLTEVSGKDFAHIAAAESSTNPILKERNFWVLVTVVGLLFCCQSATLTHMVPRITDSGTSLQAASMVMSVCAGLGIFGKLSFGWLSDYWRARHAVWFTIACQISGQLLMFQTDKMWLFTLGAALFGYGMGGVVPLQGALVGQMFGRNRFGKAMGRLRPAMFPLQIIGVPLAGWIFDTTGSYDPAFMIFLGLYVLAAFAALGFRERAR